MQSTEVTEVVKHAKLRQILVTMYHVSQKRHITRVDNFAKY